jgi:hypothetical protein
MNIKTTALGLSMTLSTALFANSFQIGTLHPEEAQISISQIQKVFEVKKATQESPTRINLVVKDLGGSTDVSPVMDLYLTFWQDGEMRDATASFNLGSTYSLVDYTEGAGKLTLKLKQYNNNGPGFIVETMVVDYSSFAAKFEHDAATVEQEFVQEWVTGNINATVH